MSKRLVAAAFVAVLLHGSVLCSQEQSSDPHDMSQMNMPAADLSNTKPPELRELPGMGNDGSAHAMHSMQSHHMDMGPHMKMTTLRDPKPGDEDRAQEVVEWLTRQVATAFRRSISYEEAQRVAHWVMREAGALGVHLERIAREQGRLRVLGCWDRRPGTPPHAGAAGGPALDMVVD